MMLPRFDSNNFRHRRLARRSTFGGGRTNGPLNFRNFSFFGPKSCVKTAMTDQRCWRLETKCSQKKRFSVSGFQLCVCVCVGGGWR